MQPERLEKVKSLIALALSKPPADREAFLSDACAGQPELRREIDSFLSHNEKTEQFSANAATVPHLHISNEELSAQATVQIPADQRIGRQFGKYLIRSRVAEGGMGIVYVALDTQLGREVALKVLREYFSRDRERLARFRREARATSLLNHPNIVTVFELGQIDGCEFIVTEFVEGETLRDLMRLRQMPLVEMLKIAEQVAGALAAAHRAGIVHRDIKPENVMVRPDGYVKVLDFGLAKLTDTVNGSLVSGALDQSAINSTTPGMIMGTVSYMSPEQAEGRETDGRTDIWALGVILYEMVAGKVPFSGPTASHTIVAILERDQEELTNATPELRHLIATALQKDRNMRFQSAEAMASAIGELKHQLGYISDRNVAPSSTAVTESMVPTPPTGPLPRRSRLILWVIPAFVLLLLGATGLYFGASFLYKSGWDTLTPATNTSRTTPEVPEQTPAISPEPTANPTRSPGAIYVEPTRVPSPVEKEPVERPASATPPERRPEPVRTPIPRPKKTPRPKPKPSQDPNCVFTNSCKG